MGYSFFLTTAILWTKRVSDTTHPIIDIVDKFAGSNPCQGGGAIPLELATQRVRNPAVYIQLSNGIKVHVETQTSVLASYK